MSSGAGTRLGPYEVVGLIGAGGMGEGYKARDMRLDHSGAILAAELSADPERRVCLEREARAIAALAHPHICTLCDIGESMLLRPTSLRRQLALPPADRRRRPTAAKTRPGANRRR